MKLGISNSKKENTDLKLLSNHIAQVSHSKVGWIAKRRLLLAHYYYYFCFYFLFFFSTNHKTLNSEVNNSKYIINFVVPFHGSKFKLIIMFLLLIVFLLILLLLLLLLFLIILLSLLLLLILFILLLFLLLLLLQEVSISTFCSKLRAIEKLDNG